MTDLGIVMPLYYQKEEHIKESIRTILNQSHNDFIFYIVIDGAPDLLPLVQSVTRTDPRVKIISYQKNQGVAHALNTGFNELYKIPTIKYVTWVSSDNIHYPFFLKTLYDGIKNSSPDIGIVYTSFNRILDNGEPAHDKSFLKTLHNWQGGPLETMFEGCMIGPSFIHKVEYCKMIAPYRFKLIQDYDYWLRMMDHCNIKYIPIETMEYRINSPMSLSTNIKQNREYHRVCWNEVHLAHWETRQRRGILPELTIVYYLKEATEQTLLNYGHVIDQFWTNYKLYLVNSNPNNNLKKVQETYNDPRVTYVNGVHTEPRKALEKIIKELDTPYFMFCDGSDYFGYRRNLKLLINEVKSKPEVTAAKLKKNKKIAITTKKLKKLIPYTIYSKRGINWI